MHTFLTCSIDKPNIHNQNIDNSERHGSQKSENKSYVTLLQLNQNTNKYHLTNGDDQIE